MEFGESKKQARKISVEIDFHERLLAIMLPLDGSIVQRNEQSVTNKQGASISKSAEHIVEFLELRNMTLTFIEKNAINPYYY
ncbi:MAG: hypothetical protein AB7F59_06575 [Bdellovibrionales bacterium]